MKKVSLLLTLVMALALMASCAAVGTVQSSGAAETVTPEPTPTDYAALFATPELMPLPDSCQRLTDLVPWLFTADWVGFPGILDPTLWDEWSYVKLTPDRVEKVAEILEALDLSAFETYDSMSGVAYMELFFEKGDESCQLKMGSNTKTHDDMLYIWLRLGDNTAYCLRGPYNDFPDAELNQLCADERGITDDPDYSGTVVYLDGSKPDRALNIMFASFVQAAMDRTIATAEPYEGDDYSFDLRITVGDSVYLLDRTNGVFSRERNGETVLYQLEEKLLKRVLTYCMASVE